MTIVKKIVRDERGQVIGSITTGNDESSVVQDERGRILGRTSERFHNTRDAQGHLVSVNTADPGLLIRSKK